MLQLPLIHPDSLIKNMRDDRNIIKSLEELYGRLVKVPKLLSLHCVVPKMSFHDCSSEQQRCISHLLNIRKSIPTASSLMLMPEVVPSRNHVHERYFSSIPSALEIISAKIIKVG